MQQALKNDSELRFECQPVSHNKLAGLLKGMFALLALMILTKVIGNHLNVLPKLHSFIPIFLTC